MKITKSLTDEAILAELGQRIARRRLDLQLTQAAVDMRASTIDSRQPVTVDLPNGRIEATGATFTDATRKLEFAGPVRTVLKDDTPDAPAADAETTQ